MTLHPEITASAADVLKNFRNTCFFGYDPKSIVDFEVTENGHCEILLGNTDVKIIQIPENIGSIKNPSIHAQREREERINSSYNIRKKYKLSF